MNQVQLKPQVVSDLEVVFPANVDHLLPSCTDIPQEFKDYRNHWNELAETWFFSGLSSDALYPKPGIDKTEALRHLKAIMGSFEPKHEHKIAGVSYLMSLWFEVAPGKQ